MHTLFLSLNNCMPVLSSPSIQNVRNSVNTAVTGVRSAVQNTTQSAASAVGRALSPITPIATSVGGLATDAAGIAGALGSVVGGRAGSRLFRAAESLSAVGAGAGALSTIQQRLRNFGLGEGGKPLITGIGDESWLVNIEDDWRVRISVGDSSGIFYLSGNPGILAPLVDTKGVIFPYTPQISLNYMSSYTPTSPIHSIYSNQSYGYSEVSSISIACDFTAQTTEEADYVLASLHFFRSATKMFFGRSDTNNAGAPPPILFLNGMGPSFFNNVPVVVQNFNQSLDDSVDYVSASNGTRIPTISKFSLIVLPQYTRTQQADFNLDRFASGDLLSKGYI